jgi:hypothetical protein
VLRRDPPDQERSLGEVTVAFGRQSPVWHQGGTDQLLTSNLHFIRIPLSLLSYAACCEVQSVLFEAHLQIFKDTFDGVGEIPRSSPMHLKRSRHVHLANKVPNVLFISGPLLIAGNYPADFFPPTHELSICGDGCANRQAPGSWPWPYVKYWMGDSNR